MAASLPMKSRNPRAGRGLLEKVLSAGICTPFWVSGFVKLIHFPDAVLEVQHFGLPLPHATAAAVIALQLGGSALAVFATGMRAALGAGALAVFTVLATLLAHAFWRYTGAEFSQNMNAFFEHISIVVALLLVACLRLQERE